MFLRLSHDPRAAYALGLLILVAGAGQGQAPSTGAKFTPKLEPVAETKLVMEGLAYAHFRGLDRLLATQPEDAQAWVFARGQALLVAETANLLMIRPPQKQGQAVWFERATELRSQATALAKTIASQDYPKSRAGLVQLANSCNRCHQAFRVPVEIAPFQEPAPPQAE